MDWTVVEINFAGVEVLIATLIGACAVLWATRKLIRILNRG